MRKTTLDERFSRQWWREQFHRQANYPRVWELAATQLEYAAEVLRAKQIEDWPKFFRKKQAPPTLMSATLMLYGLAIENLAKAILVAMGSPIDTKGRISFKSHQLLPLVRKTGLAVSKDDEFLLNKLTAFIEWAGRYPVPLSFEKMQPFRWPNGSFGPTHGSMSGNDIEAARALARRLARFLPQPRLQMGLRRLTTRSTRTRAKAARAG